MSKVITEDYRKQQQQLHENPQYGIASTQWAPLVKDLIINLKIQSISDYGAGKQRLKESLDKLIVPRFDYRPYDPAFPEYGEAKKADLVTCIDVLEHIEPELIDNVIEHIHKLSMKFVFLTIHQGLAAKTLPDGRNAHLIIESTSWWLEKLIKKFDIIQLNKHNVFGHGIYVIATPIKL